MKLNERILCLSILIIIPTFLLLVNNPNYTENYGITKNEKSKDKIYITVDLCPSRYPDYSQDLFESFIELSKTRGETIPIAISISGLWLIKHKKPLEEILKIEQDGFIKITWVNHSYEHYYNPGVDFENNFLLHNPAGAKEDIVKNHNLMIQNGLTPSNFLRFPGLISNDYLNNLFENDGYKILGADAWLYKTNGKFQGGDIILVHGNKNEQPGVKLFINNIKNGNFNNYKFGSLEDFN